MKNEVAWANDQIGSEHCIVILLDMCQANLKPNSSFFYMRPLQKVTKQHDKSWYTYQPMNGLV